MLLLILLPSLGLMAFLVAVPRLGKGLTISVLKEASSNSDPVEQALTRKALKRALDEFGRLNPGVSVQLRVVPARSLVHELSYRSNRGLAPDLLVLAGKASVVQDLYQRGFISAVDLSEQERVNIRPKLLELLKIQGKQVAVPIYVWSTLACYNNRRMPVPPRQVADLIRLSQENHLIGLDSNFENLDWIFSGFGVPATVSSQKPPNRIAVLEALRWLRQASLQFNIVFVENSDDLRNGLAAGSLEWIPCSASWIPMLKKKLGKDLGLALLPKGPAGPSMPRLANQIWAFGSQSSDQQRELARRLVAYSTNVVSQRTVPLEMGTVLPVNPSVALPFRVYPTLEISNQAVQQSQFLTLEQRDRWLKSAILAKPLIDRLLAGVQSPDVITNRLIDVLMASPGAGKR